MNFTLPPVSNYLKLAAVLLMCLTGLAHGLDDSNYDPLVTIWFPLDNKGDATMGHIAIKYTLYSSGLCMSTRDVFGNEGDDKPYVPPDYDTASLSQSHVDAVLRLIAKISASPAKPKSQVDAIVMQGSATNNRRISRDYRQNITDINLMLRLLGGIRGDLEHHLSDASIAIKN